jgi:hypothetical protein
VEKSILLSVSANYITDAANSQKMFSFRRQISSHDARLPPEGQARGVPYLLPGLSKGKLANWLTLCLFSWGDTACPAFFRIVLMKSPVVLAKICSWKTLR